MIEEVRTILASQKRIHFRRIVLSVRARYRRKTSPPPRNRKACTWWEKAGNSSWNQQTVLHDDFEQSSLRLKHEAVSDQCGMYLCIVERCGVKTCSHGHCVNESCECDSGDTCDSRQCDFPCSEHSSCRNGTCLCDSGTRCNISMSTTLFYRTTLC